jgi:hypothetical protein
MNLYEALEDLTSQISDLGVNATYNPQNLDLPGAWVTPGAVTYDLLDSETYSMQFDVYLISSNNDVAGSLINLSEMLEKIRVSLGIPEAQPVSVSLPNHSSEALPALLVTLQTIITKD